MRGLLRDFRQGVRSLRRSPGFTLIAVSTLTLGIGATTAILRLVLRRALAVSAAGLAAGLGLAFAFAPLASSFLFGVEARDPAVFAAAALVLASVALLASLHPAVRAMRVDPMEIIRSE